MLDDPKLVVSEAIMTSPPAPQKPRILELGCGSGIPTTRMLLDRGAHVVANDIAAKQLEMARVHCPEASFIEEDMALLDFRPGGFDGVVCFFTIFHLPRAEQKEMFFKIHAWLKPGGFRGAGFEVLESETLAAGNGELGESDPDYGVKFRWVAARKWRE
ncbi:S-adenosyl-L-methionine-dependent methyltransferase [Dichotomopilus funicola]|uniref:S-adenosyl-L-methionine-dependent methyltransferase n=1 Tax=Dichotomopilus funicola TaxID=1934379 RepID=A0AAN6VAF7_9PEZI|nr:S-adenosyl-L-methionine-dependent methyltransferase [Dichotomopilus funicola]